jgi:hypothetical protein
MFASGVYVCVVCEEEAVELIERAWEGELHHFLFLSLYYLRVENAYFHAGLI